MNERTGFSDAGAWRRHGVWAAAAAALLAVTLTGPAMSDEARPDPLAGEMVRGTMNGLRVAFPVSGALFTLETPEGILQLAPSPKDERGRRDLSTIRRLDETKTQIVTASYPLHLYCPQTGSTGALCAKWRANRDVTPTLLRFSSHRTGLRGIPPFTGKWREPKVAKQWMTASGLSVEILAASDGQIHYCLGSTRRGNCQFNAIINKRVYSLVSYLLYSEHQDIMESELISDALTEIETVIQVTRD